MVSNVMQADYHIHTYLCKHAKGEPNQYLDEARKKGIPEVCFTDHVPAPDGYDPVNRMLLEQFEDYRNLVKTAQQSDQPDVLFGIEADYYEGCEAFLKDWLPRQKFDMVIGSIHYLKNWGFDNPAERRIWDNADITSTWREYFELVRKLAMTGLFDIMGHIDIPKKFGHRPDTAELIELAKPAMDAIAEANMGIEINTSGIKKPIEEIYPSEQILKLACERNIPICFGSDAHMPESVGQEFQQALTLAKSVGYSDCLRMRERRKELIPLPDSVG